MALVTFLQLDGIDGEAELLEIAKDPHLSDGAAALLTAVADTNLDPDAKFDFNYLNVSGGSGNDGETENVSLNFERITVDYTETDRDQVQKTADSVEAQYDIHNDDDSANDSSLLVLITPSGPGGIGGDDFKVTYALKERDVSNPEVDPRGGDDKNAYPSVQALDQAWSEIMRHFDDDEGAAGALLSTFTFRTPYEAPTIPGEFGIRTAIDEGAAGAFLPTFTFRTPYEETTVPAESGILTAIQNMSDPDELADELAPQITAWYDSTDGSFLF